MKEQISILDYTIRGLEIFAGGVLMFISFVARSLWKDYKEMEDKVETLERQRAEDKSKIERVEEIFGQKVDRLEEITEIRLASIDKNIEKLTDLIEKMSNK